MKSVVISCKNITEEAEKYENANRASIPEHISELIAQKKAKLSSTLQSLMMTTKSHATNPVATNVATMEGQVGILTDTIYEMVDLLSQRPQSGYPPSGRTASSDTFEIEELKVLISV
jgi:hypothetical protein